MNTSNQSTIQRIFLAACIAAAANLGLAPESRAATVTWDGGGGAPGNWKTGLNWGTDTAPLAGDSLYFAGATQTSTTNDYTAGTLFGAITFDGSSGGSFTLAGNSIRIAGNITTAGTSGAHTIGLDLVLTNHRSISQQVNANVSMAITGNISESGGSWNLTKGGIGSLTLTGNNSFTGTFWAQGGVVKVNTLADAGTNSSVGAGSRIQLGVGGNTGTLIYIGTTVASTNRQVQIGTVQTAVASTGGATINNSGTQDVVFTAANFNAVETSATNNRTLTVAGAGNGTIQGVIADNAATALVGVTKADAGTWTLSGSNTYTGVTTVSAGTLLINGNQTAATGAVNVVNGATLGGTGTIGGVTTLQNLATLAPGTTPGSTATLTLNNKNLTINGSDSKLNLDIAGTTAGTFDQIAGINAFTQNGDITFTLNGLYTDTSWNIFAFGSKTGDFDSITLAGSYTGTLTRMGDIWAAENIGGSSWQFDQATGVLTVVPEPATWVSMISAVAMTAIFGRRRRSS